MDNKYNSMFEISKELIDKQDFIRDLRVTSNKGFKGSMLCVDCWEDGKDHWKLPFAYAIQKGYKGTDETPDVKRSWPKSDIGYIHNQKQVTEDLIVGLKEKRAVRLIAGTGFGKSVVAINIAKQLKTNCLIVVPTNEILKQFRITAKDLFKIDTGVIKGAKCETDKLVVLTTFQTLSRRIKKAVEEKKLDDIAYLSTFGMVCIDEAHLCGCESFKIILHHINAKWRLSVSADFYRSDKLEGTYERYLGPVVAKGIKDPAKTMRKVLWVPKLPGYVKMNECSDKFGEFSYVEYLTTLAGSIEYNEQLAKIIKVVLGQGGRRILVGLKRIRQAEILEEMLGKRICGIFTGEMNDKDLTKSAKKKVICSTKSDLGLDFSKYLGAAVERKLDPVNVTLVAYPTRNSLQFTGRGGRENRGKPALIIHPIVDDYYSRAAYKACHQKNYRELELITRLEDI